MTDNDNINGKSKTTVVNLHREDYDVYIGRAGRGESGSFGNPFSMKLFGREGCIQKFEEYFLRRVQDDSVFREKVLALSGKKLGCFCAPKRCHGEIIVAWIEEQDEIAEASTKVRAKKPSNTHENKQLHLKALAMKLTPDGITTSVRTPEERDMELAIEKQRASLRMD